MKTHLAFLFAFLYASNIGYARVGEKRESQTIKISVDTGSILRGRFLAAISDSAIYISDTPVAFNIVLPGITYQTIPYYQIDAIKIKKSSNPVLIGGGTGLLIGAMIGFASGDDKPTNQGILGNTCLFCLSAAEKAVLGGISLGALGTGVGALAGSNKKVFLIERRLQKFNDMKRHFYDQ